ncbi:MAG: TonB-dependent receptor [Flavitalea sp.]
MIQFSKSILLIPVFLCCISFSSICQEVGDTIADQSRDLEPVIIRSFDANVKELEVPAAVTVVKRSVIDKTSDPSFIRAMNSVSGVKMDERSPGSVRLSIRGNLLRSTFGVRNVKVYWNGVPFTDANGNTYLNQVGFDNVGQMEVLKGPSGSMYGSGTGGVLLVESPTIDTERRQLSLNAQAGSHGMLFMGGKFTYALPNSQNLFSFSHQESEGYRDQSRLRRDVANYLGKYRINQHHNLTANIFYSDLYYQTPGGLNASELSSNPRQARPGAEANKAALSLKTFYAGLGSELRFGPRLTHFTGIYSSHTRFKNPTTRNYESKTEQGMGGRSTLTFTPGSWKFIGGGEYQYSFSNTGVYGNRLGNRDTLQYQDELDSRQFNVFVQADYRLKRFLLSAGLSYNNYHYGFFRPSLNGSSRESSDFKPNLIPRLAVLYKVSDEYSIYATVGKGYSPPSIDEVHASDGIFNTSLRAEEATSYEIGLKANALRNKLQLNVAGYFFSLGEAIVSRRDTSGADFYVNAGKTRQLGLEGNVQYTALHLKKGFARNLVIRAAYTHINAEFVQYQQGANKFDGNAVTGIPAHMFNVGVDFDTEPGVLLTAAYNYTGSIPLNDANSVRGPHYNQLFFKAAYRKLNGKKFRPEIFITYEKCFDDPYSLGNDLNAAGSRFFNPAAPERFSTGIKLDFSWL